ncbi:MAG TPA: PIN domain-containing protein [Longimicrobium sp.]
MIYLHYRHVEEVDWLSLLASRHIVIVVPRITVRELDKHKDSHPSRDIRERARRILQRIEGWQQSSELREGVRIETYPKLPRIDLSEHDLDPSRADDVLIATILQFRRDNPDLDVLLVTQDTTPKLTARPLGIAVSSLPEELRLHAAIDPVEQENRDLRRQLDRLRAATPKLALQFITKSETQSSHTLRINLARPPGSPELFIAEQAAELERKYPPLTKSNSTGGATTIAAALAIMGGIPESEFARYNRDRIQYFEAFAEYLRSDWERRIAERLSIDIEIQIVNSGTAPAEDVDVHLHFPDGFLLVDKDSVPEPAKAPSPPVRPRTQSELFQESMRSFHLYQPSYESLFRGTSGVARERNVSYPHIEETGSYDVDWHVKRVKHQQPIILDPLRATFESFDDVRSFGIEYRLLAANVPEPIEGKLNVVVETAKK